MGFPLFGTGLQLPSTCESLFAVYKRRGVQLKSDKKSISVA